MQTLLKERYNAKQNTFGTQDIKNFKFSVFNYCRDNKRRRRNDIFIPRQPV